MIEQNSEVIRLLEASQNNKDLKKIYYGIEKIYFNMTHGATL